ncbi:MAG: response regulator [Lachnospiraceae bacterium]|nr:response regulator [Lachnospiraceae bacterium]
MKYKTLITGKNTTLIDDFFIQMDDSFELISTSQRFNDVTRHVKYFRPELFVYCIGNETRENMNQMVHVKNILRKNGVPFVVVGAKDECDEFERTAVNVANLAVVKPYTVYSIQEDITKFMEEWQLYHSSNDSKPKETELPISEEEVEAQLAELRAALAADMPVPVKSRMEKSAEPKEINEVPEASTSQRTHILVVDDDPLMLKMLKEQLRDDYDVATAVSGKIAMKFLERKKTNLILLDYEMPGETGPEILEKLRANDVTKDIPVIFLTGVSEREKIQEALVLKPQSYLLKPVDHEKLRSAIAKVVG